MVGYKPCFSVGLLLVPGHLSSTHHNPFTSLFCQACKGLLPSIYPHMPRLLKKQVERLLTFQPAYAS